MGATCSKKSNTKTNPYAKNNNGYVVNSYNKPPASVTTVSTTSASAVRNHQVKESGEKQEEANVQQQPSKESFLFGSSNIGDEFYDGIPRYQSIKSRSIRRQSAVAKVSEVSSRLTRAGTVGLGKAVEVLDTLGSSMTNLNSNNGFASGVAAKGNELAILAFEVANTVVKGANLMQSLSKSSVRQLKEELLFSEGVQNLISKNMDELLSIIAADKREELKIFSGEVVRFGNRCKDPQWHNLDRYFEKIIREQTPHRQLPKEAESMIEPLMILVQYTAELYHELLVLDRMEQECQHREKNPAANQKGESLAMLMTELKSQKKRVRNVKKKSLWSRSLEEVMEKLVDIVHFLILGIDNAYFEEFFHNLYPSDGSVQIKESASNGVRLGPAGLSLHYANVVLQIDNLVARSSSTPPNSRETLYQNLPPSIKSALCSKLQSFTVKDELTIPDIKDEMEKTLQWLVPIATNTAKAHHGFGWVGEWAGSGTEANRKPATGVADIMRIETLHHAEKEITEAYILELVLWLNHLISKTKGGAMPIKPKIGKLAQKSNQQRKNESPNAPTLTIEDPVLITGNPHQNNESPNAYESSNPPTLATDDPVPVAALLVDEVKPQVGVDGADMLRYKGKHGLVTVKT